MGLGTLTAGLQGASGGVSVPLWSALPAGVQGDKLNATLDGAPIVAERGISLWHPGYPTAAQIAAVFPTADQFPGVRVGAMRRFRRAVAEVRAPRIALLADSNSVGQGGTVSNIDCRSISWPKLMATRFGWRDGWASPLGSWDADSRVSRGGWSSGGVLEAFGAAYTLAYNGPTGDLTFTPGVAFDTLTVRGIAVLASNTCVSSVYVDDVLVGTIAHNQASTSPFRTETPSLTVSVTRGTHVVKIAKTAGTSGSCYITGIETRDSQSTAPELIHSGTANSRTSNYVATNAAYTGPVGLRNVRPDVVILASTINDLDAGDSSATVIARQNQIAAWADDMGADFVGICGWACNRVNITKTKLDELSANLLALAQQYGGAWVDNRAILGYTYAETDPANVADAWHLTAPGYAIMENQIRRVFE